MPRRGENIFKRKDGRWEARYIHHYENGAPKYRYLYGHTYAEAKAKKQFALSHQTDEKTVPSRRITLETLSGMWLSDIRISVKESTFTRYHLIVTKYIVPHLGKYEIARTDRFVIGKFSEKLLKEGGMNREGLSPKTVADILCVLKSIIKFGTSNGYPFGNTEGIRFPQRAGRQIKILPPESRKILEISLLDSGDTTSIGILLSLFTGIRIGELCGLRWGDIDLAGGTVSICRTVERIADLDPNTVQKTKIIISEPKTENSVRVIPLPGFLTEHLERYRDSAELYVTTGKKFPVEPHGFYIRYKHFMKKHHLAHYTFHALRHTFATRCVEEGFDAKSLSEILGHSNISTTLALYVHPSLEQKRTQMERLSPHYSMKSGGKG